MNVTIKDENKFEPIKLEIIIETEEELFELFHRVNCNALPESYATEAKEGCFSEKLLKGLDKFCDKYVAFKSSASYPIFRILEPLVTRYEK